MTYKDLKNFIAQISDEYDEYEIVNGEVGYLDPSDENSLSYRVDKPIIALYVDEQLKELCFLHQTREDVLTTLNKGNNDLTETT